MAKTECIMALWVWLRAPYETWDIAGYVCGVCSMEMCKCPPLSLATGCHVLPGPVRPPPPPPPSTTWNPTFDTFTRLMEPGYLRLAPVVVMMWTQETGDDGDTNLILMSPSPPPPPPTPALAAMIHTVVLPVQWRHNWSRFHHDTKITTRLNIVNLHQTNLHYITHMNTDSNQCNFPQSSNCCQFL